MAVPRTAKKADVPRKRRVGPFRFGEHDVAPGTRHDFGLPIARLPAGSWINMPVSVLHGARPGPVLWMNAAIHGDELNGVVTVRQLLAVLDPARMAGTLLAVPMVNAFGVISGSRYLPDRKDLNRSFPGSARGSLAGRLAHVFFHSVVERCEFGIDLHTGSAGRTNLPHVRCDLADARTLRLARAFGSAVVLGTALRGGSVRAEAVKRGIRVLLFEGGEAERLDEEAIVAGRDGALRVMAELGMIETAPPLIHAKVGLADESKWMRADQTGLCRVEVEPGELVRKGQRVAVVHDAVGPGEHEVKSRIDGVVVGALRTAVVHRGDSIVHVAHLRPHARKTARGRAGR